MPNEPDEFVRKFWLASDVKSKFIINNFRYLRTDATKVSSAPFAEFVVSKFIEPYTYSGRNVKNFQNLINKKKIDYLDSHL